MEPPGTTNHKQPKKRAPCKTLQTQPCQEGDRVSIITSKTKSTFEAGSSQKLQKSQKSLKNHKFRESGKLELPKIMIVTSRNLSSTILLAFRVLDISVPRQPGWEKKHKHASAKLQDALRNGTVADYARNAMRRIFNRQ